MYLRFVLHFILSCMSGINIAILQKQAVTPFYVMIFILSIQTGIKQQPLNTNNSQLTNLKYFYLSYDQQQQKTKTVLSSFQNQIPNVQFVYIDCFTEQDLCFKENKLTIFPTIIKSSTTETPIPFNDDLTVANIIIYLNSTETQNDLQIWQESQELNKQVTSYQIQYEECQQLLPILGNTLNFTCKQKNTKNKLIVKRIYEKKSQTILNQLVKQINDTKQQFQLTVELLLLLNLDQTYTMKNKINFNLFILQQVQQFTHIKQHAFMIYYKADQYSRYQKCINKNIKMLSKKQNLTVLNYDKEQSHYLTFFNMQHKANQTNLLLVQYQNIRRQIKIKNNIKINEKKFVKKITKIVNKINLGDKNQKEFPKFHLLALCISVYLFINRFFDNYLQNQINKYVNLVPK